MKARLKKYKNHLILYLIVALLITGATAALVGFKTVYAGQIYPNVYIGDLNFGKMTEKQAVDMLNQKTQALLESGITLKIKDKNIDVGLREYSASDPDLSRDLIKFDLERTVDKAYKIGRDNKNIFKNLTDLLTVIFSKKQIEAKVDLNKKDLISYLKIKLKKYETERVDAKINFRNGRMIIDKDAPGFKIDHEKLLKDISAPLKTLKKPNPEVILIVDHPIISKDDLEFKRDEALAIFARAPFTLEHESDKWVITKNELKDYLKTEKKDGDVIISVSEEKMKELINTINKKIGAPARDAKFTIENGRVTEFQSSQLGLEVDKENTLKLLSNSLTSGPTKVNVLIKTSIPKVTTSGANDLGISDLLGVGTSNFAGSPKNRRHNIKVGAEKLNGIIIPPGEEFSLIKALGNIDAESGFKTELVIKGDRTVPEFGGGLCQIGTTIFRTTLSSGLPITERRNHSYRVSYYEPAGTDATIYDPAPDYKFVNDTPGSILIQTYVNGDELLFEFWGTNDGRVASTTKPHIYNITNPPKPKYIVTKELAPGVKKKIESAHKGASANFTYYVDYADENKEDIDRTFYSYYRPWAEVWMIGATNTLEDAL